MIKDANFSECGKYRFWLSRLWAESEQPKHLMLIGLNPSTADAENDDPTIRRIITLAKNNGYGGIMMTNLFAQITPYPDELDYDIIHEERNYKVLEFISSLCMAACFCWGNFDVRGKGADMVKMFPDSLCFGKNKNGSPKHPLYLKGETKLIKY